MSPKSGYSILRGWDDYPDTNNHLQSSGCNSVSNAGDPSPDVIGYFPPRPCRTFPGYQVIEEMDRTFIFINPWKRCQSFWLWTIFNHVYPCLTYLHVGNIQFWINSAFQICGSAGIGSPGQVMAAAPAVCKSGRVLALMATKLCSQAATLGPTTTCEILSWGLLSICEMCVRIHTHVYIYIHAYYDIIYKQT